MAYQKICSMETPASERSETKLCRSSRGVQSCGSRPAAATTLRKDRRTCDASEGVPTREGNTRSWSCHLLPATSGIIGRDDSDPERMKPSPYRVREAVGTLDAQPGKCAFIGDSPSDVLPGRLAIIGYANKPGKASQLTDAGADAVTTDLAEITTAL
jgi:hypothetical protein